MRRLFIVICELHTAEMVRSRRSNRRRKEARREKFAWKLDLKKRRRTAVGRRVRGRTWRTGHRTRKYGNY